MAVITPSALISEIRGSVGSQTFSRNRSGPYVKGKLIMPPSSTPLQVAVRAQLTAAIAAWKAATQSYQTTWMVFAGKQRIGKNISRKITRAGYNEFVSRWMNRYALGASGTGFMPLPLVRINTVITSITQGALSIVLNYDTLRFAASCKIAVYATPPISPGINQLNPSLLRIIGSFSPGAQIGSEQLYTMYTTKFPLAPADVGKKICIAVRAINTDNYAAGGFFFVQIIISGGLANPRAQVQLFNDDYYSSTYPNFMKTTSEIPSAINLTRGKLWKFYNY